MEQQLENFMQWFAALPEWLLCPALFGLALLQYVFPPVPSDTLLVALGILVTAGGADAFAPFITYSVGAMIGATALFELFFYLGDKAKKLRFIRKLIDDDGIEKARKSISKYGGVSYFFLRFIPSMQCITIITMGLVKLERKRAYFYVNIVTLLACGVYYAIGLLLGDNIGTLVSLLSAMGTAGWIVLCVIAVAVVTVYLIIKFTKRDK